MAGSYCSHRLRASQLLGWSLAWERQEESFQSCGSAPSRQHGRPQTLILGIWPHDAVANSQPPSLPPCLCLTPCFTIWFILSFSFFLALCLSIPLLLFLSLHPCRHHPLPPPPVKFQTCTKIESSKMIIMHHKPITQLQQLSICSQSCFSYMPTRFCHHSSPLILLG